MGKIHHAPAVFFCVIACCRAVAYARVRGTWGGGRHSCSIVKVSGPFQPSVFEN